MHPSGHVAVCYIPLREPFIIRRYFWLHERHLFPQKERQPPNPTDLVLFCLQYAHVSGLSITSLRSGQLNPPYDTPPCLYLGTRSET